MSKFTSFLPSLDGLNSNELMYKALPHLVMEIMKKYFRLEVEGIEHIPKEGPVIIAPNHSGYSGFDAMILAHEIHQATERVARVLTHHLWFMTKATAIPAHNLGFIEATTKNGLNYLKKKEMIMLFPEGEYGNFKPSTKAYQLQEFKRGFVRMALQTSAHIVPTLVLGAEETHINLAQLKFTKYLRGTILPIPLNIIPLPAKWKIVFMESKHLPFKKEAANDSELVHELATDIQERMQLKLNSLVSHRSGVFI